MVNRAGGGVAQAHRPSWPLRLAGRRAFHEFSHKRLQINRLCKHVLKVFFCCTATVQLCNCSICAIVVRLCCMQADNQTMRFLVCVAFPAVLALLSGCSPAFDWRTVRVDATGLELLLPCKPDKGSRSVPFAGQTVEMSMVGCDAGGATFAVSWVLLPPGVEVADALSRWQSATLANIHAVPPAAAAAAGHAAFIPAGALPAPQALRMATAGQRANGDAVVLDAAWFARKVGTTTYVLNAVMYSAKPNATVASTFFEGIRFP